MNSNALSQPQRFWAFLLNSAIFYLVYVWATGHWHLTGGGETLWLMSGVAWWTLGLLSAPWYRPPKDALGAGVAALLALLTLDLDTAVSVGFPLQSSRLAVLTYYMVVIGAAIGAAIVEKDSSSPTARFSYLVSERLSSGPLIFGTAALISIFAFYTDPARMFWLCILWLVFALVRPIELAFLLVNDWRSESAIGHHDEVGSLLRVDDPNIIRVAINEGKSWENGLYVAFLPGGDHRYVIPLFSHVQDETVVGTGLIASDETPAGDYPSFVGIVTYANDPDTKERLMHGMCGRDDNSELVGFVVEGSEIGGIQFEVSKHAGLKEGSVVFCTVDGECVFYQVVEASTKEESFRENPRGTHIVTATQLGVWSANNGFEKYSWLPRMNIPIFKLLPDAKHAVEVSQGEFLLGNIPSTSMSVKGSLPDMIAYHTAILGVTGTGKTELVLDLIEEAVKQGTKVFCVDLTGEYRKRLAHLAPKGVGLRKDKAEDLEKKLFDVEIGEFKAGKEKKVLKEFIESVRSDARKQVGGFLRAAGPDIALFELAEVTNTRATLMSTELFLSEIMLWARMNRKARRILIVLEEAHTIIPETSGSGFDFETQSVVSKIGQIALQGRKYGVGLFIVSQRTALVSKTVLSQCNTFITHALVDQTSLQFLLNIYDRRYVGLIPNLQFLQFLAYGKGIVSERPLLLERAHDPKKAEASAALDEFIDIAQEIPDPAGGPAQA